MGKFLVKAARVLPILGAICFSGASVLESATADGHVDVKKLAIAVVCAAFSRGTSKSKDAE